MSKVYQTIGSLKQVKAHLDQHGLSEFSSLQDVIRFHQQFEFKRQAVIAQHSDFIKQEKNTLSEELVILKDELERSREIVRHQLETEKESWQQKLDSIPTYASLSIKKFFSDFRRKRISNKLEGLKLESELIIEKAVKPKNQAYLLKRARFDFLDQNLHQAVDESARLDLLELDKKHKLINAIMPTVWGAVGENKVVKELERLPDGYFLINDLNLHFPKPLYYKEDGSYIQSVQIDHVLVSPAGVFVIETKHWSRQSLANLDLRSPVQQIKRAGYAMYMVIQSYLSAGFGLHRWGKRKIPVRNVIVFINQKPIGEFSHVKILILSQLRSYISYFEPSLSESETERLTDFLRSINPSSE